MNDDKVISGPGPNNPLCFTKRVSFELSNICNNALFHRKCPLNNKHDISIMPKEIVVRVLEVLKKYDFSGMISFHNYNEPGIDPRLISFIEMTKKYCPNSKIYFSTNGFYLNQSLLEEYEEAGVDSLHISAYSRDEYDRLCVLKPKGMELKLEVMKFDNRLSYYDGPERKCIAPCYAPLAEVIIDSNADVVLCCWDWKYKYRFGNLKEHGLEEILASKEVLDVYKSLSSGIRRFDICKRCGVSR